MPKQPVSKSFQLYTHGDGSRRSYPASLLGLNASATIRDAVERIIAAVNAATGDITPSMTVEYVDASGTFQTASVASDGSTSISGIAPFLVHFDAKASRGALSNNNTAWGAWNNLGFRLNYGEARGGTWPHGQNNSRDEDFGAPIWGHVYETVGTHTTRLRVRDTNGAESTLPLTVNVAAPPAATIIEPGAGSWPTWVSGTHYQLRAGANYTSFGTLNLRRVHNVLISKIDAGADPIVGQVSIGDETVSDLSSARDRTRHVRLLNIDISRYYNGIYGGLHCGAVNGRVRRAGTSNPRFSYEWQATTPTQRGQIRYPRGFFLYNTGLMSEFEHDGYAMAAGIYRGMHSQGVLFQRPASSSAGSFGHVIRDTHHVSSFRNCQIFGVPSAGPFTHYFKAQADGVIEWSDGANGDLIGPVAGGPTFDGGGLKPANTFVVLESLRLGAVGEQAPNAAALTISPQNADPIGDELHDFVTVENIVFDRSSGGDMFLGGSNLTIRNARHSLGTGSYVGVTSSFRLERVPDDRDGPYFVENANTRPIPSAF